ncbi:MAG TPA: response regulator [Desulfomonilaceae bacterium]|nr:response regulator [Desulfomonilaceae bacterium]
MTEQAASLEILLAEDNPVDVLITREAMRDWEIATSLHVVQDGKEALDFLYKHGNYAGKSRPDLVMLDLNLPKASGKEVLAAIKQDPDLQNIVVVIVTTSRVHAHLQACRDLGANLCITKPLELDAYIQAVNSVKDFWLSGRATV